MSYRYRPKTGKDLRKQLEELYQNWKEQRLNYPGWEVCPKQNRDSIWFSTEHWVFPILDTVGDLCPPEDLFLPLCAYINETPLP